VKSLSTKYSSLFSLLDHAVEQFIKEVHKQRLQNMATEKWSVKDVLRHISFWHRYYAQSYSSLAARKKPFIFTSKGGSTRNQEGVDSLTHKSKGALIKLLVEAQKSLYKNIVINEVPKMNYTDRNEYETEEFLRVVIGHINRHTIQVRRAKKINK